MSLIALFSATACQTSGQTIGTGVGAAMGGLIGSQFGSGTGQLVATGLGVAIGGLIGNQIGRMLDEQNQQRLASATQETIYTGQAQQFADEQAGVRASTRVIETQTRQQEARVPVLRDRVEQLPPFEFVGEKYELTSTANVRGGPGTDFVVLETLQGGTTVDVIGRVEGAPWLIIGQGGVGSGFLFANLARPTGEPPETMLAEDTGGRDDVELASASASQTCRTVEQQVTLDNGQEETQVVEACQGPNGWQVI